MTESEKRRDAGAPRRSSRRDRTVVLACVAAALGMGALSFAAVPLYRLFCQVTGYAGTPQRADAAPDVVLDRTIAMRFDGNVAPGLPWTFEPVVRTLDVRIGENVLAFYKATNTSDRPVKGTASFNVSPDIAGSYFSKIECFCFTEQTLAAGETVEMPVSFFVDPRIVEDKDARRVTEITLSYTFHPMADETGSAALAGAGLARGKGG